MWALRELARQVAIDNRYWDDDQDTNPDTEEPRHWKDE